MKDLIQRSTCKMNTKSKSQHKALDVGEAGPGMSQYSLKKEVDIDLLGPEESLPAIYSLW